MTLQGFMLKKELITKVMAEEEFNKAMERINAKVVENGNKIIIVPNSNTIKNNNKNKYRVLLSIRKLLQDFRLDKDIMSVEICT